MTAAAKKPKVSPAVEKAVTQLLRSAMKDKNATLLDKLRVLDRALKLESIKAKVQDEEDGAFFTQPQEEIEDERNDDDGSE